MEIGIFKWRTVSNLAGEKVRLENGFVRCAQKKSMRGKPNDTRGASHEVKVSRIIECAGAPSGGDDNKTARTATAEKKGGRNVRGKNGSERNQNEREQQRRAERG